MTTYRIPAVNLHRLESEIEQLNKRARRLKVTPITFDITGWDEVTRKDDITAVEYTRRFAIVRIDGVTPKLGGWRFVAKVEPTDAGNLVKELPGETAPAWAFDTAFICQHCNTNRQRAEVFIVAHEDGRALTVGRNCLADFLGHTDPNRLARMAEFDTFLAGVMDDSEGDDWIGGGWGGEIAIDTESYLATVAAVARVAGFVTRSQSNGGPSTADTAWDITTNPRDWEDFTSYHPTFGVTTGDLDAARAAVAWAQGIDATSNYERNLQTVANLHALTRKQTGLAASMILAHRNAMEREIARAERAERAPSRHVGTIGERITFDATVTFVREFQGHYGVTTLIKFIDDAGNDLSWFASGEFDINQGERFTVKGTIKKHDEYQGRPFTQLSRCRLTEHVAAVAA